MEKNLNEHIIDGGASINNVANYNAMDCFVMPSYYEGLPVVGIEAQATGLACVFSSEITKETVVTEKVAFLDLDREINVWATEILNFETYYRKETKSQLTKHGYNIEIESQNLRKYYESISK